MHKPAQTLMTQHLHEELLCSLTSFFHTGSHGGFFVHTTLKYHNKKKEEKAIYSQSDKKDFFSHTF